MDAPRSAKPPQRTGRFECGVSSLRFSTRRHKVQLRRQVGPPRLGELNEVHLV